MAITGMALAVKFSSAAVHLALLQQAQETVPQGTTQLLTIFVGLTAFALLVAAIALAVIAFVALKLRKEIMGHVTDIKAKAMPIMDKALPIVEKSNVLITDLTPQIKSITAKVNEIAASIENIAGVAKDKVQEFSPAVSAAKETFMEANTTARDVNQKTRVQVERVNGMIAATLDATSKLGQRVHHSINTPAREIAGIVTGVKAGLDTFLNGARGYGRGPRPGVVRPVTPVPVRPAQDIPSSMPLTADKRDLGL